MSILDKKPDSDEILNELVAIFGENFENFNEESIYLFYLLALYKTLEGIDSNNLIKGLIFLSFDQRNKITQQYSHINELTNCIGILIYYYKEL